MKKEKFMGSKHGFLFVMWHIFIKLQLKHKIKI